ncbi:CDP-glycerol glycerophosphotransferase family protein [Bifidobacterium pullorum subsp. saeculare]|uniref:CDP-glycerol glycerophosphotransferase family protein n=1 Tax=Bifidobacterium pullorum subsp. saeculare TaxID=78257 RepID=A0A938WXG2_9BIFI|nr:CDP-glycerol glycerophosphotransferase family protein [Bifidobacterium pullorum]MBM6699059.1 CDP-glycerol glycerophosphotransferase family protein [Bifidobacterium pullorum subsp. saeculare]
MEIITWAIRLISGVLMLFPRRRRIALLSRQSARPFDFKLLEPYLNRAFPGYDVVWCCVRKGGRLGPLTGLRQLWLSITSSLCIVDGYVPSVSIPRISARTAAKLPPCVQLWHAMGAIKCFGRQSLDTPAGRTTHEARALGMHRGYALVIAGLAGARGAFAEAFGYGADRIVPLGLPRADYLLDPGYARLRERRTDVVRERLRLTRHEGDVVLYAPTFRKHPRDAHWQRHAVDALRRALPSEIALVVSGHPLDRSQETDGTAGADVRYLRAMPSIDALGLADYVVTDYSAIAFEAALAQRKVLFYVPDIAEYRLSPGLNIDPVRDLPSLAFQDARELGRLVADDQRNGKTYDADAFAAFMRGYGVDDLRDAKDGTCERIVRALSPLIDSGIEGKKG